MALLEPVKLKLFFPENLIIQKDSWKLTSLMAEEIKNLFQHTILFVCSLFPHEILTSFFKKEKKNAFSFHSGCCCCSVTKLRLSDSLWLHELQPTFPVLHYLPNFAQTQVHWISDAIQPFHPLLPPSILPSIFPSIKAFSNELTLCIRWPIYWSFQRLSFQWIFRVDFLLDWLIQSSCCPRNA